MTLKTLSIFVLIISVFSCKQKVELQSTDNAKPILNLEVYKDFQTNTIYDTLENTETIHFQKWLKHEDSLAENYFIDSPIYEKYLKSLEKLEGDSFEQNAFIRISELNEYFYVRFDVEAETDVIYFQKTYDSKPVELFNCKSNNLGRISYLSVSYDSKILAIGFENENGFSSDIFFLDVKTKTILDDKISNISPDYGGIEWLPDSSGFVYLYFPIIDKNEEGFKENSFSTVYYLGNNNQPKAIFGRNNRLNIQSDFYPKIKISSSEDKYLVGYVASSNDFYEAYVLSVKDLKNNHLKWRPFFELQDSIYYNQGIVRGDEYFFRQSRNGKTVLAKVNIENPDFDNPEIIASKQGFDQIRQFDLTKKDIYYSTSKFGSQIKLYKVDSDFEEKEIETPFTPGYLKFFGASVSNDFIGIGIDGWTSAYKRYLIKPNKNLKLEGLHKRLDYSAYDNFKTALIDANSHDAENVPLTLIYENEIARNSENKVLMYVYGAYGENIEPYFEPMLLEWIKQGNILAFAHVRGGGEKGKNWHLDGMKLNKFNSWKDLIACSEYLIENKITQKGLISVFTSSAGGITAAMAVNERPDLFSSLIADVPRLNPYHLESEGSISSTSYLEYGSVNDSIERIGLIAMDPFLNILEPKEYPATYVSASYKDDRIPIWDNSKYITKLRDSTLAEKRPIIFDLDFEFSHSSENSPYAIYFSRLFTFAESNMQR